MSGLQSAYPRLRAYGMNYYDPFLAAWLLGSGGPKLARKSVATTVAFNSIIAPSYRAAGALVAGLQTRFETTTFALTGSADGMTVPQNVAVDGQGTHLCTSLDSHADDAGHAQRVAAFDQVIDGSAVTGAGTGYWLGASDGGIFTYGGAGFFGSAGSLPPNKPIVGMAPGP